MIKLLIDTNIFIALELGDPSRADLYDARVFRLPQLAEGIDGELCLHRVQDLDLARDRDAARKRLRERQKLKYRQIRAPSEPSDELAKQFGTPDPGTNDYVDLVLLETIRQNRADYLVTNDSGLHKAATKLGLGDRVLPLSDTLAMLSTFYGQPPTAHPRVRQLELKELNIQGAIFDSVRQDYPDFNEWFSKVRPTHGRQAWVIDESLEPDLYKAVCIGKEQGDGEYGIPGRTLKLSTFKVADRASGMKLGELLLKEALNHAYQIDADYVWLTVFGAHDDLIGFLEDFGFETWSNKTARGELVLVKALKPTAGAVTPADPLEYHIKYGPRVFMLAGAPAYLVPIQPQYFSRLFPDSDAQWPLIPKYEGCGTAIKKAYLSRSALEAISPASLLFFYRSRDVQAVLALGIAEKSLRSSNADELARFVSTRTVYTYEEISDMCAEGREVLAILFREARYYSNPVRRQTMTQEGIIQAAPQSITRIKEEGAVQWLIEKL